MLPLDHKTGMCWVCSSSTPSPSNTTTGGSSEKDAEVASSSSQKEDDDLFNFFDSPVRSSSKGKGKEDGKNSSGANIDPSLFDDLFDTLRL